MSALECTEVAGIAVALSGERLIARGSGALWWPGEATLIVADLHLGKSERNARRHGVLWPPYESNETLARIEAEVNALSPVRVIALGDSFDDMTASQHLPSDISERLCALASGREWIWAQGNHDPAPTGLPGKAAGTLAIGPLTLRHIAKPVARGEISGHYHPKARFRMRGRRISRPCFLMDETRLILPAFGAYTGGLDVCDPVLSEMVARDARVILTGRTPVNASLSAIRTAA